MKSICLKLTQDDLDKIAHNMKRCKMTNRSAYLRTMATKGEITIVQVPELQEILRLVSITSNNVNQIAKRANETGHVYQIDMNGVLYQWQELRKQLATLLTTLTPWP